MTMLNLSRRDLITKGTKLSILSAAGLSVLTGLSPKAFGEEAAKAADMPAAANKDVDTLNVALGLEHQGIGAYQLGADSGLLKQPALNIALLFQSHHKAHRDTLVAAIQKLGGTPVVAQSAADYAKQLNAASLKSQEDILKLALGLEPDFLIAARGPAVFLPQLARVGGDFIMERHATQVGGLLGGHCRGRGFFHGWKWAR